MKVVSQVKR